MKTSSVIGLASALVRSRKFKILLVGLQLGFLAINYLTRENENENDNGKGKRNKTKKLKAKESD